MRALASLGVCLLLATAASGETKPGSKPETPPTVAAEAPATCDLVGFRLEDEIARKPALREPANEQTVRDLRTLRDAAIVLDAFKRPAECTHLLAIVRELVANPDKAIEQGGDTDEDKAEAVEESRAPKTPATASPAPALPSRK